MSDLMGRDPIDTIVHALREAELPDPALRGRIMDAIHRESGVGSRPTRTTPDSRLPVLSTRRGAKGPALQGLAGLALAAGVASVITLGAERPRVDASARTVGTLDTVASAIRDTARLVQFMLVAPTASRVALAGEFNGWDPRATPLAHDGRAGNWTVALTLPPGRHRYAVVIDDTGWVEGEMNVATSERR